MPLDPTVVATTTFHHGQSEGLFTARTELGLVQKILGFLSVALHTSVCHTSFDTSLTWSGFQRPQSRYT